MSKTALLALEDGSIFYGKSLGVTGETVGEVVFNTSMTGYQEILTDPSYAEQIITFTYPHIGNVGVNKEDMESDRIWARGMVIRDLPLLASNFRSEQSLDEFLSDHNLVAIAEIDTRRLTRLLREKGALKGAIISVDSGELDSGAAERGLALAADFAGLKGMDLAKVVSSKECYEWKECSWQLGSGYSSEPSENKFSKRFKVVAYDFGVKRNILRLLLDRGCDVTVVPAQTPADEVMAMQPDGVFLSNGPGDPEPCGYAIAAIKAFLDADIPMFGICLGHQLLSLASGATTLKMKFGHHGANHPVKDLESSVVHITSQNHGFAVDEDSLPNHLEVTHRSLFDNSIQGIRHKEKAAFGFQGHPEASPGPQDAQPLFDQFIESMARRERER